MAVLRFSSKRCRILVSLPRVVALGTPHVCVDVTHGGAIPPNLLDAIQIKAKEIFYIRPHVLRTIHQCLRQVFILFRRGKSRHTRMYRPSRHVWT